jgi:hypothetical protein
VDPKALEPYRGETGTLSGTVRIEGDPPPDTGLRFPPKCTGSQAMYGKLFRVGAENALADVLVAVTGYEGFVPAQGEVLRVTLQGCALSRRTFAGTFGQRIEVADIDSKITEAHVPYLEGSSNRGVLVAVPNGPPVKLYPTIPAASHYVIRDQLRGGFFADVYMLRYATVDVTGLDGRYEIRGIPVGKVHVNALLPVLAKTDGKDIEIKSGDNTLDFTLKFDAKKDIPKTSTSATAPPSTGAVKAPVLR